MTAADLAPIVAHQGGWDEIAMVALPIVLFAGLLFLANHRAEARLRDQPPAAPRADGTGRDPTDEPDEPTSRD